MANIIPPEFFGLYGLGSSLQGIGNQIDQTKQRKRQQTQEEIELMAALDPTNRLAMIQQAEAAGLLPPGSADNYVPSPYEKFMTGGWDSLTPDEQLVVSPQLGLQPGQTPDLARRGATANVKGAEQGVELGDLQISAARTAEQERADYADALNSDWFKKAAGVPGDVQLSPGSIEAYQLAQGLDEQRLTKMITEARANHANEREIAEIEALRARTRHINFQLEQMRKEGADDGTLAWMRSISQNTGWSPAMVRAALSGSESMPEATRDAVLRDVGNYQESLRAGIRQKIRDGNNTAGQTLSQLVDWHKAGIELFEPDDPVWMQFTQDALNEVGVPAAIIEEPTWFGLGSRQRLTVGNEAQTYLDRAANLVGEDTSDIPTIDANSAAVFAGQLVDQYQTPEKAIEFVSSNQVLSEADKRLLTEALNTLQGSGPTNAPEGVTPPANGPRVPEERPVTTPKSPDEVESPESLMELYAALTDHRLPGARNSAGELRKYLDRVQSIDDQIRDTQDRAIAAGGRNTTVFDSRIAALESRRDKILRDVRSYAQALRNTYLDR